MKSATLENAAAQSATATPTGTQYAVELYGPGQLRINAAKPIPQPGPHQLLLKVEAVGLCFSDMKLLKQFDQHPRKQEVVSGLAAEILAEIPTYAPGTKPTVPGHEVAGTIVSAGSEVKNFHAGERVLLQPDFRDFRTKTSNGAMGYNFEGGLQEYVLIDERMVIDRAGERFLLPVTADLGASQVALVEPWACVENSYVTFERQTIKPDSRLLVVVDAGCHAEGVREAYAPGAPPRTLDFIIADPAQAASIRALNVPAPNEQTLESLPNEGYDDIVYFGHNAQTIELLNDKLAGSGIINLVLNGASVGRPVSVGVGRVHYANTRWIGTFGPNASVSYTVIPSTGEVRDGDKVVIIGAGGPMGQMHVIRNICSGRANLEVVGTDMEDARIAMIELKAAPSARENKVNFRMQNTQKEPLTQAFSYYAIMAPVGAIVADSIAHAMPVSLINIFAGIPAPVKHALDLDAYIQKRCFMFGTSGSTLRDMQIILEKVVKGQINTNASVDAVSGMAGALDGLAAVENRTLAGKIIVYPMLHNLPLTPLAKMKELFPTVAAKMQDDQWNREAELELLRVAGA